VGESGCADEQSCLSLQGMASSCLPEPIRFAQGKLREGSRSVGLSRTMWLNMTGLSCWRALDRRGEDRYVRKFLIPQV